MSLENVSTEVMIKSIVIDIVNVISGNELKAEQVDTNDEFHVAKKSSWTKIRICFNAINVYILHQENRFS